MSVAAPPRPRKPARRGLGPRELAQYRRDGFVFLAGLFERGEVEPLRRACQSDPDIDGALIAVADSSGNPQEVVSWTEPSDDLLGVLPRIARIVDAARAAVGEPIYHWHSKLSMKRPRSAGRWDWHQDFGYWYHEGCLAPAMTTCMIAIDRADKRNGCVQLVKGSHLLGRLDHRPVGEASGVDPARLERILERMEVVDCAMAPGDAVLFHCNTLHASGPNRSDRPRTLLHCSYNAVANSPFMAGQDHHRYRPLAPLSDDAIKRGRYRSVIAGQSFNAPDPDAANNTYGYRVLRHPRRDRPAKRIGA